MDVRKILTEALNLTEAEFRLLADYAYCDMIRKDQSVADWQRERLEGMMEEEQMEYELGEPMWRPGDKNKLIDIFYR